MKLEQNLFYIFVPNLRQVYVYLHMNILIKQNIFEDLVFISVHLCTSSCVRTQSGTVFC